METATQRTGFALPAALLAIVIVGALVTGGVYAAMEEDRSSGNVQFGNHAFLAAERGLEDLMGTKDRPYFQNMGAVGTADVIGPVAVDIHGVQAQYTLTVQRLNLRLFRVNSEGEVLSGGRFAGSKRILSEMMRITYTYVPKDRAVTTHAPLTIRGLSGVSGVDNQPAGWTGCPAGVGVQTGVVSKGPTSDVKIVGAGGITGSPEKRQDAAIDSLSFIEYGDMHLDDLKLYADKVLSPATYTGMGPQESGGVCTETAQLNWGDPDNPAGACHYYWPIIYTPGDLHVSTGSGQGILIVDGNLHIGGNFQFSGIVFVYGSITAAGTGNKITGSLNILGDNGIEGDVGQASSGQGNTQIVLSSCAIERAHLYNERFNRPIPLRERKFIDMSGIGAT